MVRVTHKSGILFLIGLSMHSCAVFANEFGFETSARYRFQQIDDPGRGDANASTLKLRLSANWTNQANWDSFVQADYVHAFNEDDYNSVTVTRATSPIPDVPSAEINQAWLKYSSDSDWSAILGRQLLSFDNERHISSVEFWQNDQTFDALTLAYNDSIQWHLTYSYISKVHRIFSDDSKAILPTEDIRFDSNPNRPFLELGNHDHNTHLVNLNYAINQYVDLTAYAYLIDNKTAQQLSSNTYGIRVDGAIKPDLVKYGYTAEVAHQQTADTSPWDFNGDYVFGELSAQYKSHLLAISHERLSENNGFAFATSLGNNHKFLGWADIFTSYLNNDGVRDTYITYRGRVAKLRWQIVAHQFASDTTGAVIGQEVDIEVAYRYDRDWELTLLHSSFLTKNGLDGLDATQNDLQSWTLSLSYKL